MNHLIYRAGAFGYFVLVGPWVVMGLLAYQSTFTLKGYEWALLGCVLFGAFFVIWLRGFLVRISTDELKYRDGYYKTAIIQRGDIISVKFGTEKVPLRFGGSMRFRALVVKYKADKATKELCINPLPFGGNIETIMKVLRN